MLLKLITNNSKSIKLRFDANSFSLSENIDSSKIKSNVELKFIKPPKLYFFISFICFFSKLLNRQEKETLLHYLCIKNLGKM